MKPVAIDFETLGIEPYPHYPPSPVGVSIKYPGKPSRYYAFGHIEGNNCTWPEAREALAKAYAWGTANKQRGLVFQNAKFDLDVADVHMGLPIPSWEHIHDTMLLLYLDDPHQHELGLKPSAERLLGLKPEEQDEVRDWLLEHQPLLSRGIKISKSKQSEHYYGRYIALAPGDLVGRYAVGDTDRTDALFDLLYSRTYHRGMQGAYDRERRLLPILLRMERRGLPMDVPRLRRDIKNFHEWMIKLDDWVFRRLKTSPEVLNLNSGEQLVQAMIDAGAADPDLIPKTKTGKYQSNKDALLIGVTDKTLLAVMKYRAQLKTCVGTFMVPWLEQALATGGFIHTPWNQVKSTDGANSIGTRTGRLSSSRFQNIPKEFTPIFKSKEHPDLPACPLKGLPDLPLVRSYIIPFPGYCFIDRDYSQQEPRILAHFDGGELMDKYLENPWIDFHDYARDELAKRGRHYERKPVKNTNLGLIYGMGAPKLAVKNNMTVLESKALKDAILQLYPGLKAMYQDMRRRARANLPVRTWGGREYYCEPARMIDGRIREFDYKLVNVLIQGSAADCTKEAIIRLQERIDVMGKGDEWFIILNVHDQLTAMVPIPDMAEAMELMRQTMEGIEFDVPMLSEGSVSFTNWAELVDYDKKGKPVNDWKLALAA